MLEIVLTSSESGQYSSAPKEISKFPLMYMTGYFCRSVYNNYSYNCSLMIEFETKCFRKQLHLFAQSVYSQGCINSVTVHTWLPIPC